MNNAWETSNAFQEEVTKLQEELNWCYHALSDHVRRACFDVFDKRNKKLS